MEQTSFAPLAGVSSAPIGPPGFDATLDGVVLIARLFSAPHATPEWATAQHEWRAFESALLVDPDSLVARMARRTALSGFELQTLFLLLGMESDPNVARLVSQLDGSPLGVVTVRAAIDRFVEDAGERVTARRSFLAGRPFVDRHLVTLGHIDDHDHAGFLDRPLRLTPPVVRYCLGEPALPRVRRGAYTLVPPSNTLSEVVTDPHVIEVLRALLRNSARGVGQRQPRCVLLVGPSGTGKSLSCRIAAASAGRPLLILNAAELPPGAGLVEPVRDALTEAWLSDALVEIAACEHAIGADGGRSEALYRLIDDFDGTIVLTTSRPELLDAATERRVVAHLRLEPPDATERLRIWEARIPATSQLSDDVDLELLAARYDFTGAMICNALAYALSVLQSRPGQPMLTQALLEQGAGAQLRDPHTDLTIRHQSHHTLADIVLPEPAATHVHDLLAACRNRATVMGHWGFGRRLATGRGIVALFDGPPGTGKSYCAEILANELGRPLHRVNLAEVASKWVGETEKHIMTIFRQAHAGQAVLLFDEADALFGGRVTDVRSASDRQSNTIVNLLLQEIERYEGVTILTTNFQAALDDALRRRVGFRISLEEPKVDERERLWQVLTPAEAPLDPDVDFRALAQQFELTGATIKNVLLRAAYRCCDKSSPITQEALVKSAEDEYVALGRVVTQRTSQRGRFPGSDPRNPTRSFP